MNRDNNMDFKGISRLLLPTVYEAFNTWQAQFYTLRNVYFLVSNAVGSNAIWHPPCQPILQMRKLRLSNSLKCVQLTRGEWIQT